MFTVPVSHHKSVCRFLWRKRIIAKFSISIENPQSLTSTDQHWSVSQINCCTHCSNKQPWSDQGVLTLHHVYALFNSLLKWVLKCGCSKGKGDRRGWWCWTVLCLQLDTFSDSIMAPHFVAKRCLLLDIPDTVSLVYPAMYLPPLHRQLGKYPLLSLSCLTLIWDAEVGTLKLLNAVDFLYGTLDNKVQQRLHKEATVVTVNQEVYM